MKKFATVILSLVIIGGMFYISGCKKDDTTKPTITLKGNAEMTIDLGQTFTDPGVTADDDTDGDITTEVKTTGTVDNTEVNVYEITYTVTDKAGNESDPVVRKVYVQCDKLKGTYNVHGVVTGGPGAGTWNYVVTVSMGSTYDKLLMTNFAGLTTNVTISAFAHGANITIPSQANTGAPAGYEGIVVGTSGTYDGSIFKILTMNYTLTYDDGTGTDSGTTTWTKQ